MRTAPRRITRYESPSPMAGIFSGPLLRTHRRRILLVEDDRDIWPVIRRIASQIDSEAIVDCVPDAISAVERMSGDDEYDVVLADFLLEGTRSGYWLEARCQALQPRARFVMMSAMPLAAPGIDESAFLRKPFTANECRSFLQGLLFQ